MRSDCDAPDLIRAAILVALSLMFARVAVAMILGANIGLNLVFALAAPLLVTAALCRLRLYGLAIFSACYAMLRIGSAALFVFTAAPFAIGRAMPMADKALAFFDQVMCFDWVGYLMFVEHHYWINDWILAPAYNSIFWQPFVAVVILCVMRRERDALLMMASIPAGIMMACVIAVFVPAYGAYHYYGVTPPMHPHLTNLATADGIKAAIDWLRAETPVGDLPQNFGGLITYPSFHTTAALLFLWTYRGCRPLLIPGVPLNVAMLFATPLHGSHYLADMAVGAALTPILVSGMDLLFRSSTSSSLSKGATPLDAASEAVSVTRKDRSAHSGEGRGLVAMIQSTTAPPIRRHRFTPRIRASSRDIPKIVVGERRHRFFAAPDHDTDRPLET